METKWCSTATANDLRNSESSLALTLESTYSTHALHCTADWCDRMPGAVGIWMCELNRAIGIWICQSTRAIGSQSRQARRHWVGELSCRKRGHGCPCISLYPSPLPPFDFIWSRIVFGREVAFECLWWVDFFPFLRCLLAGVSRIYCLVEFCSLILCLVVGVDREVSFWFLVILVVRVLFAGIVFRSVVDCRCFARFLVAIATLCSS